MRAIWLTAVLGACGFSHGALGNTPSDADMPRDSSRLLDAAPDAPDAAAVTTPDAAPDAGSTPTDTDGDTIADSVDNCPLIANTDQRDHDGDGKGDVCDHCPHLADATDPDTDGDGVGDACDPRPSVAGDSRVIGGYVANNQSYTCSVGAVPIQGNRVSALGFWRDSNNNPQFSAAGAGWTGTYAQGSSIRLTGSITGGNIGCTAVQGATTVSTQTNAGPTTTGVVQLTTNQLAVDFDYVFVVNAGS